MSTPDDSILSLFIGQPLVLWSFVLGVLILVTAVTLYIISNLRRKRAAKAKSELLVKTVTISADEQPAEHDLSEAMQQQLLAELEEVEEEEAGETAVNPLEAIAAESEGAEGENVPEFAGVEVNSKLADLFQNDIIIDPHVQALRDSLDDVLMADLLAQLHDVADQLKEHIPQPALEAKA